MKGVFKLTIGKIFAGRRRRRIAAAALALLCLAAAALLLRPLLAGTPGQADQFIYGEKRQPKAAGDPLQAGLSASAGDMDVTYALSVSLGGSTIFTYDSASGGHNGTGGPFEVTAGAVLSFNLTWQANNPYYIVQDGDTLEFPILSGDHLELLPPAAAPLKIGGVEVAQGEFYWNGSTLTYKVAFNANAWKYVIDGGFASGRAVFSYVDFETPVTINFCYNWSGEFTITPGEDPEDPGGEYPPGPIGQWEDPKPERRRYELEKGLHSPRGSNFSIDEPMAKITSDTPPYNAGASDVYPFDGGKEYYGFTWAAPFYGLQERYEADPEAPATDWVIFEDTISANMRFAGFDDQYVPGTGYNYMTGSEEKGWAYNKDGLFGTGLPSDIPPVSPDAPHNIRKNYFSLAFDLLAFNIDALNGGYADNIWQDLDHLCPYNYNIGNFSRMYQWSFEDMSLEPNPEAAVRSAPFTYAVIDLPDGRQKLIVNAGKFGQGVAPGEGVKGNQLGAFNYVSNEDMVHQALHGLDYFLRWQETPYDYLMRQVARLREQLQADILAQMKARMEHRIWAAQSEFKQYKANELLQAKLEELLDDSGNIALAEVKMQALLDAKLAALAAENDWPNPADFLEDTEYLAYRDGCCLRNQEDYSDYQDYFKNDGGVRKDPDYLAYIESLLSPSEYEAYCDYLGLAGEDGGYLEDPAYTSYAGSLGAAPAYKAYCDGVQGAYDYYAEHGEFEHPDDIKVFGRIHWGNISDPGFTGLYQKYEKNASHNQYWKIYYAEYLEYIMGLFDDFVSESGLPAALQYGSLAATYGEEPDGTQPLYTPPLPGDDWTYPQYEGQRTRVPKEFCFARSDYINPAYYQLAVYLEYNCRLWETRSLAQGIDYMLIGGGDYSRKGEHNYNERMTRYINGEYEAVAEGYLTGLLFHFPRVKDYFAEILFGQGPDSGYFDGKTIAQIVAAIKGQLYPGSPNFAKLRDEFEMFGWFGYYYTESSLLPNYFPILSGDIEADYAAHPENYDINISSAVLWYRTILIDEDVNEITNKIRVSTKDYDTDTERRYRHKYNMGIWGRLPGEIGLMKADSFANGVAAGWDYAIEPGDFTQIKQGVAGAEFEVRSSPGDTLLKFNLVSAAGAAIPIYEYDASGSLETVAAGKNGTLILTELRDTAVCIQEIGADGHYTFATQSDSIDVTADGQNVALYDIPSAAALRKVDAETGDPLNGAEFQVWKKTGPDEWALIDGKAAADGGTGGFTKRTVAYSPGEYVTAYWYGAGSGTSTLTTVNRKNGADPLEDGYICVFGLPDGTYKFVETKPAGGYGLPANPEWEFTVSTAGPPPLITLGDYASIEDVTAENTREGPPAVKLRKLGVQSPADEGGWPLAGIGFELVKVVAGQPVNVPAGTQTTDGSGNITWGSAVIEALSGAEGFAGVYRLYETLPPKDAAPINPISFEIGTDGKITITSYGGNDSRLVSYDPQTYTFRIKNVVTASEEIEFSFTNTYNPTVPVTIGGKKVVDGAIVPTGSSFTFRLRELNSPALGDYKEGGANLTKTVENVSAAGDYNFDFDAIEELLEGETYWYEVWEEDGSVPGWSYDTGHRLVTVTVAQGEATVTSVLSESVIVDDGTAAISTVTTQNPIPMGLSGGGYAAYQFTQTAIAPSFTLQFNGNAISRTIAGYIRCTTGSGFGVGVNNKHTSAYYTQDIDPVTLGADGSYAYTGKWLTSEALYGTDNINALRFVIFHSYHPHHIDGDEWGYRDKLKGNGSNRDGAAPNYGVTGIMYPPEHPNATALNSALNSAINTLNINGARALSQAVIWHFTLGWDFSGATVSGMTYTNLKTIYDAFVAAAERQTSASLVAPRNSVELASTAPSLFQTEENGGVYYYGPFKVSEKLEKNVTGSGVQYGDIFLELSDTKGGKLSLVTKSGGIYNPLPTREKYGSGMMNVPYVPNNTDIYVKINDPNPAGLVASVTIKATGCIYMGSASNGDFRLVNLFIPNPAPGPELITYVCAINAELFGEATLAFNVSGGSAESGSLTFRNAYTPAPVTVLFNARKTAEGKDMAAGQFAFALYDSNAAGDRLGDAIRTAANASAGISSQVNFTPALEYTQPGEHYYLMVETGAAVPSPGWLVSSAEHLIKVVISDGGDGKLAKTVTYGSRLPTSSNPDPSFPAESEWIPYRGHRPGSWPLFHNAYRAGRVDGEIEIPVFKTVVGAEGLDITDMVFTFELVQTDEEGEEITPTVEVEPGNTITIPGTDINPGTGTGMASFTLIDPDEDTYYFLITELDDNEDDDWTYNSGGKVYFISITVADIGGELAVTERTCEVFGGGGADNVTFINTYLTPGIPFSFLKTGRDGEPFGPDDAVFALYALDCDEDHTHDELVTADTVCWKLLYEEATGENGLVSFEEPLPSGDYMLVETRTKSGFQLPFGQWLIQVNASADPEDQIRITGVSDSNTLPPAFAPDTEYGFIVINYPHYTLPRAGISSYTLLLYTAGGAAALGAAGFLGFGRIRRKRKKTNH